MNAYSDVLKARTTDFAITVLRLVDRLPTKTSGQVVGRQLARCGTSIGANYRGACTARSRAEFIAKLGVAVEEAEETVYWLDVIVRAKLLAESEVQSVRTEARELLAILAKSVGTARANSRDK